MSWSLPIFRIAGIQLRIHITFLLLIAWLAFGYYAEGGSAVALGRVLFVLLLFVCVVLHEFGHAIAAKNFGINTPDITLLPIGGVAPARVDHRPGWPAGERGDRTRFFRRCWLAWIGGASDDRRIRSPCPTARNQRCPGPFQFAAGISDGRWPCLARASRHAIELCTGHANRRQYRPGLRICFRFHRPFWKSPSSFHCLFCLHGCVARSGPRSTQRYFAQFSGFERNGARIPFASAKRYPSGGGR